METTTADSQSEDVPDVISEAIRSIPRHRFAAPELHPQAYRSEKPSLSEWQGVPPDRVVAQMIRALDVDKNSTVLEFGADLGFTAAVLGQVTDKVYAVRQGAERREMVRRRFDSLGIHNVELLPPGGLDKRLGDARFDGILVSLVDAKPRRSLAKRLVVGGNLVVPREADDSHLRLFRVTRQPDDSLEKHVLGEVRYSFLLGDILVDLGAVSRSAVERAAEQAFDEGHPIGQILLEQGIVTESDIYEALALQNNVEFGDADVLMERADPTLIEEASRQSLQHQQIIPLRVAAGTLEIASVNPDPARGPLLRQFGGRDLKVYLVGPSDFRRIWQHLQLGSLHLWDSALEADAETPLMETRNEVYDARLRNLFQTMLGDAVAERASDIHLERYDDEARVRFRIDGCLRDIDFYPLTPPKFDRLVNIIKVQAELPISKNIGPQSGRFRRQIDSDVYDFRVQTQPTLHGEGVVLRLLPHKSEMRSIDELGFPERLAGRYRRHLDSPSGLVFLVGPTSSGKTTSLYAGLQHYIDQPDRKVITVEDPIEYAVQGVEQTEVDLDIDYTFSNAVRTLVRQDPDVVIVGEIRDEQTALQAVRASQTGHLVLATLHANDAVDAVQRLFDLGLKPKSVASELVGIFAQRLARRVCEGCRRQVVPDKTVVRRVFPGGEPDDLACYAGEGCPRCRGEGTHGRIALVEYLQTGPDVRRAIAQEMMLDDLREYARASGLTSLKESGLRLVRQGTIPLTELPRLLTEERLSKP